MCVCVCVCRARMSRFKNRAPSVALDGTCYAASSSNAGAPKIYRRDALVGESHSSMRWSAVNGSLTRVAVGRDGVVWGITASHKLYRSAGACARARTHACDRPVGRLQTSSRTWIQFAGEWSRVSVRARACARAG